MDLDKEILDLLRRGGAGFAAGLVPWEPVVARYRSASAPEQAALGARLLAMIDLDYRNPHSEDADADTAAVPLPAAMKPDDLLCLEAAVYAAAELGLPGARDRLQAVMRAPRFHAVFPGLRHLHMDLNEVIRRLS